MSSLVRVKEKHQITLPGVIREEADLSVGDWLEVRFENGRITLIPKSIIDRRIADALQDIEAGRVYGPFDSIKELSKSLHGQVGKNKKTSLKKK